MNQTNAPIEDQDESLLGFSFSFQDLKSTIIRQRYVIGGVLLAALIIGAMITLLQTPIHQASVTIEIDADRNEVTADAIERLDQLRGQDLQRYITSQIDIVKSRSMATRIANDLQLAANDSFIIAMGEEGQLGNDTLQERRRDQVIDLLINNVDMVIPFGSKIATLTFTSADPEMAQRVVNSYSQNLIAANIERRFQSTSYARDFLEKEIAGAKERLEDSERDAIVYARDTRIIDASDGVSASDETGRAPRSITTANLVKMNADLAAARTARILAEQEWEVARTKAPLAIAKVSANPTIQALQTEKAQRQAELRELLDRYKPDHPVAQQSSSQIESLEQEIDSIAGNIKNSILEAYTLAQRQEASLARDLESLKNTTLDEQNKRVELNLLAREADTNRTQYQALLERYKQISTASDVVTNNIAIIDSAESASVVSPRPFINMALATFVGLALGFLIAFLRETFDDSVRTPDDVSRKLSLPLLGTTPLVAQSEATIDMLADRKSEIAEAYSSIRSSLDFSTASGAPKSLLVTSSQPSEGKSTSSIAIAESFARLGKKVLLIDADLRNPSLHKYLGQENNHGFVDVITGNAKLESTVNTDNGMHFSFLSCGPIPPDPTEIVTTAALKDFLAGISDQYDQIVIDGPPVMGLADSPQMSRSVIGTVLVVEAGRIRGGQTKTAIRRLADANANIVGVVLSKFDGNSSGYGEYYGYQYSYTKKE